MEQPPAVADKVLCLLEKGVSIPNPATVTIDDDVNLEFITAKGVTLFPGCRIAGESTVISAGCQLGREGPVVIEDCQLGPGVELKGGYFRKSVFLEKANMGLGAQIREGCILEEEANGAHCVGLKQTILLPFVTLGSLINFCDCLMAGGTSRKDHSEVGSGYIHFNFTPEGDKTTASLIGDVPRGVMLNQPRIFLGGQGGIVGPVRLGYGNVIAAGTVLRHDVPEDNKLIYGKSHRPGSTDFVAGLYPGLTRLMENNIRYLANLIALEEWYTHIRQPFFANQEFGIKVYEGALDKLSLAKKERKKRLKAMADKMPSVVENNAIAQESAEQKSEFYENIDKLFEAFEDPVVTEIGLDQRYQFLEAVIAMRSETDAGYIKVIQSLSPDVTQAGTQWLQAIVDELCGRAAELLPSLELFMVKIDNLM